MQLLSAQVDAATSTAAPTTADAQPTTADPRDPALASVGGSSALASAALGTPAPSGEDDGLLLATTFGAALALGGTAWEAQRRRRAQAAAQAGRARGRRAAR